MFDIGPGEFIALAVLALLVLGPDKLPGYAADAARFIKQVRRMATDAREEVTKELGPELDGLSLRDINPRSLVRKHVLDGLDLDLDDDEKPASNGSNNASNNASNNGSLNGSSAESSASEPSAQRPAPYDPDTT